MALITIPTILILSFVFTRLTHPLSIGLTLLIQTILVALSAGVSTYSFWFSYILFIIFLGGILVLFIYVSSLASNEFFSFSFARFFAYFLLSLTISLTLIFSDLIPNSFFTSLPSSSNNISTTTPFIVSWIYSDTSIVFTLFIVLYLLLTLIVVVKITNLFKGPLRLST